MNITNLDDAPIAEIWKYLDDALLQSPDKENEIINDVVNKICSSIYRRAMNHNNDPSTNHTAMFRAACESFMAAIEY